MKKIISLLFFLIFIFHSLYSQHRKILDTVQLSFTYNYTFKHDSLNIEYETEMEMILQIGKKHSSFTSKNMYLLDSISFSMPDYETSAGFKKLVPYIQMYHTPRLCNYNLIKINNLNTTMYGTPSDAEYVAVDNRKILWNINFNTDTLIYGYKCKKATTHFAGRNYIAWFTHQIPIADGPYKFSGLPGLIIKIEDKEKQHCFSLIKANKPSSLKYVYYRDDSDYITTSPENYVKAFHTYNSLLFDKISRNEIAFFNSEDDKVAALNRLMSKNNFIERY